MSQYQAYLSVMGSALFQSMVPGDASYRHDQKGAERMRRKQPQKQKPGMHKAGTRRAG
jgi:hypothetical protein